MASEPHKAAKPPTIIRIQIPRITLMAPPLGGIFIWSIRNGRHQAGRGGALQLLLAKTGWSSRMKKKWARQKEPWLIKSGRESKKGVKDMAQEKSTKKLAEIEEIGARISKLSLRLLRLSRDADAEVRYWAIEQFAAFPLSKIIERSESGLAEPDELVRVNCLEILGDFRSAKSKKPILKCLRDKDVLVRSAAAEALADIEDKDSITILEKRINRADDRELVSLYGALYRLGRRKYFKSLLGMLSNKDYVVRCAAANSLPYPAKKTDRDLALSKLRKALEAEKTRAAGSSIKGAIKYFDACSQTP